MAFKLTDTHYDIIAHALELYADAAHNKAIQLHKANFVRTAQVQEGLCCDARELAQRFEALRRADARCEVCGSTLAHVAGAGVTATLCPECDRDRLHELTEPEGG